MFWFVRIFLSVSNALALAAILFSYSDISPTITVAKLIESYQQIFYPIYRNTIGYLMSMVNLQIPNVLMDLWTVSLLGSFSSLRAGTQHSRPVLSDLFILPLTPLFEREILSFDGFFVKILRVIGAAISGLLLVGLLSIPIHLLFSWRQVIKWGWRGYFASNVALLRASIEAEFPHDASAERKKNFIEQMKKKYGSIDEYIDQVPRKFYRWIFRVQIAIIINIALGVLGAIALVWFSTSKSSGA
ncbi:hypothetical protein [Hyphococcus sp.]|uniref:hypothetical protein n=1 Tax=Hyphococcus sp. TaxID=2038636 RepID=UPI0035C6B39F